MVTLLWLAVKTADAHLPMLCLDCCLQQNYLVRSPILWHHRLNSVTKFW